MFPRAVVTADLIEVSSAIRASTCTAASHVSVTVGSSAVASTFTGAASATGAAAALVFPDDLVVFTAFFAPGILIN